MHRYVVELVGQKQNVGIVVIIIMGLVVEVTIMVHWMFMETNFPSNHKLSILVLQRHPIGMMIIIMMMIVMLIVMLMMPLP
jgi:uncharacterized membrane protein YidH (DUF202 family)